MSATEEALKIWKALKPMVNRQIEDKTRSSVRAKKMTVTTPPVNGVVGVTETFCPEIFVPCSASLSDLRVGDAVWVWYFFNNASTMIVLSRGNGQFSMENADGDSFFVIPEMFGAVGDGVADDTDAINAALQASRVVILPPNTYRTTKPIYLHSYNSLIGVDKYKSRIYNTGLGYMKNAVVCGIVDGDSNPNGIKYTPSVPFTKVSEYVFTSSRTFTPDDLVHFKVAGNDDGYSQLLSTSTYIITASNGTYTTFDPIPDNAELHAYADVSGDSHTLPSYTAFGTLVENLTIEHLPTGSGMYCLFLCGGRQTVRNVRTVGNTGLASNLSIHNLWENIECVSYGDNLDCAEYIYNTVYRNIAVRKSSVTAQTLHTQLAFGRGHDILVDHYTSNIENPLACSYTSDILFVDSSISADRIDYGALTKADFLRCDMLSSAPMSLAPVSFKECVLRNPSISQGQGTFEKCTSSNANLTATAKSVLHLPEYEKHIFRRVVSLSFWAVPAFDNAYYARAVGSGLSVSNGSASVSASREIVLAVKNDGAIYVSSDGGAYTATSWSPSDTFTMSGTITYLEQDSLVGTIPA